MLFAVYAFSGCASTGIVKKITKMEGVSEQEIIDNLAVRVPFEEKKRFIYLMAWNRIPVGRIVAEIEGRTQYKGREVFIVKLVTESNKFLSKIYRVEDTYISYVDVETFTSRRYEADRKEGNYRKHVVVEYNFEKLEATYTNLTDGSVKTSSINKEVHDPLSAIYYFMTLPVVPEDKVKITVNLNRKNYDVYGIVDSIEAVKLKNFGLIPAFKIKPYVELENKQVRKGTAWLYCAADETRYPLYGVVKIPFGTVTATLVEVEDI